MPHTGASPPPSAPAGARRRALELFLLSFLALFLELMVIRWAPSVVRLVAYYANLMLISSFLGLGVGAMIGRKAKPLFAWLPVLLAASVALLLLAQNVTLPSTDAEHRFYTQGTRALNYVSLVGIFVANATVFVPLGQRIGGLFEALPPLHAYAWDLGGSLAGTLSFGLFSLAHFSPALGFAFVSLVILALLPRRHLAWAAPLLALSTWGVARSNDPNAIWSPYYYITVHEYAGGARWRNDRSPALGEPRPDIRTMRDPPTYSVSVNHDFYQPHGTMDERRFSPARRPLMREARVSYDLPYLLAPRHDRVLVLGAGGGTDAEVALLNGAAHVDAVEIDPVLVALSRRFSASAVYDDPRVGVHVDDARAWVRRSAGGYDMVVFGWLDSQALFSSMSNIRLDGYIYTVESMRAAYRLLNEHGTLALSFAAGSEWMSRKLVRMVTEGSGRAPIVYRGHGQVIIVVPRGEHREPPPEYGGYSLGAPEAADAAADAASEPPRDDWPFLYLSGRQIPADYLIVIGALLALSLGAVRAIRGSGFSVNDEHFLFLGLAFLLLETKSIGDVSLYFGTTWVVTMIVVAGVLLMVLAANLVAMRLTGFRMWMYAPLVASLLLVAWVRRDTILALTFTERALWSVLVIPLPIFFAGLIFSTTFREAATPAALFGANLIGAMIGGFCEYLGMIAGTSSLMVVVIAAYLASLACRVRLAGKA